jgi:hypothetical protein
VLHDDIASLANRQSQGAGPSSDGKAIRRDTSVRTVFDPIWEEFDRRGAVVSSTET